MQLYFFEEFPTKSSLDKINLIEFPTKLIVAAPNIKDVLELRKKLADKKQIKEIIYWPVLKKAEGYYISLFSKSSGLKRALNDALKHKMPVMLDLEFPLKKNLLLINIFSFFRNKRMIADFLKNAENKGITIYTAEYEVANIFFEKLFSFLFLTLNPKKFKHKRIVMLYTSFIKNERTDEYLLKQLEKSKQKYVEDFLVGLGVIATGVGENEPILSPEKLNNDLSVLKREGIDNAVIFRLGGLNKKYIEVIKKYVS